MYVSHSVSWQRDCILHVFDMIQTNNNVIASSEGPMNLMQKYVFPLVEIVPDVRAMFDYDVTIPNIVFNIIMMEIFRIDYISPDAIIK